MNGAAWSVAEDLHSLILIDPNSSSPSATAPGIISHQQPAFRNNVPIASSLASSSGLPYSANSSRVSTPLLPTSGSISGSSYPRKAKISLDTFPADVLRQMDSLRGLGILTDVDLLVESETFSAHRIVLAAASPYFKAMFVEGREQCDHGKLVLKGISGSVMADFLRCLYTGEVFLSQSTVCQLLSAAVMFQVAPLLDACCTYLTSLLDSGNAIGIAAFAQRHGCEILHRHAVQFIERHFVAVSHSMEFLELPSPRVMEIIKSSNLNIAEERIVYDAVMRWVKHDEGTRTEKATALMKGVRCEHLPETFLQDQLKRCALIQKSPSLTGYLARVYQDIRDQHKHGSTESASSHLIYVVGGYQKSAVNVVECWNPKHPNWESVEGQWNPCSPLPEPRSGCGAAILQGILYVAGGRIYKPSAGSYVDTDRCDAYDPYTKKWTRCTNMLHKRNRLGLVTLDGFIYAVGGCDKSCFLRSAERYDPTRNVWDRIGWLITSRVGAGYAVDKFIYAIGGFDGADRLKSVEQYDPTTTQWNFVASMKEKRSGAGVAAMGKFIYVFGGFDGSAQLNTIERYDIAQDVWHCVAVMNSPRSALAVCVVSDRIYTIGGYDGQDFRSDVDIFDPATQSWDSGLSLKFPRSGHAAAVAFGMVRRHNNGMTSSTISSGESKNHSSNPGTNSDSPLFELMNEDDVDVDIRQHNNALVDVKTVFPLL